jgi:NtrC-family two-component system response regulator AlgB
MLKRIVLMKSLCALLPPLASAFAFGTSRELCHAGGRTGAPRAFGVQSNITMALSDGKSLRVLVVDDEKNIRTTLAVCLEGIGCRVACVGTPSAALSILTREPFDLAFVDLRLDKESGMDLIPELLSLSPSLPIVIITAYATVDTAVEAIRRGARDYLAKPFSPPQVRHIVEQTLERRALGSRVADLEHRLAEEAPAVDLTSESPAIRAIVEELRRASASDVTVLLRGESGTGKGVFAHLLHQESARRDRPFVTVNCPTLTGELLASELFGHVKGAFTGAVRDQIGRVEAADGGTLFLDEIAELPPALQAKLLRFLQEKQFERVGDNRTRRADVRLIAATNRNLEVDVAEGRFREDLLYRLNVVEITVPPLRERREDILRLASTFLAFFSTKAKRPALALSASAEQTLVQYAWPGNIRELRNVMERVAILWPAQIVEPLAFPERIRGTQSRHPTIDLGGEHTVEQIEREHIERVVGRTRTAEEAANILGIDASTLWRKRRKFER